MKLYVYNNRKHTYAEYVQFAYICSCNRPNKLEYLNRVRTDPGKPGKYWNLIITIPGLEYTGISSKVLENTGI